MQEALEPALLPSCLKLCGALEVGQVSVLAPWFIYTVTGEEDAWSGINLFRCGGWRELLAAINFHA